VTRHINEPPDNAQPCPACDAPVRYVRVLTDVTVQLDAKASSRGCFYYLDPLRNLATEDPYTRTFAPRFTRHRCHGGSTS
jgi:hypothetical protein